MVFPTMMFPSNLLNSASKLLIPEICSAYEQKDLKKIEYIAVKAIYSTLLLSFFISGVFLFFSEELCIKLYNNKEAGTLLKLLSALIPILYIDGIIDSILKGINEQISTMTFSIVDSIISVILIAVLLPRFGICGYIAVTYISSTVNTFLGIARFFKITDVKLSVYNCVIIPFCSAIAALFPIFVFESVTAMQTSLIIDIAIGAFFYVFFLLFIQNKIVILRDPINRLKNLISGKTDTFPSFKTDRNCKPSDSHTFKM